MLNKTTLVFTNLSLETKIFFLSSQIKSFISSQDKVRVLSVYHTMYPHSYEISVEIETTEGFDSSYLKLLYKQLNNLCTQSFVMDM